MSDNANSTSLQLVADQKSVTVKIVAIVFFNFICYLLVGIPLAVLPTFVHLDLGYGSVLAGLAISVQYVATFFSRPYAGKMADLAGPKQAVLYGLLAAAGSGACCLLSALLAADPGLSLVALLGSRLMLGVAESLVGTGGIMWGISRVGANHTAQVISWSGIATYGALALGAPLGVLFKQQWGFASLGLVTIALALAGAALAWRKPAVKVLKGERMPFYHVFWRVVPHGLGLALGGVGFGCLAAFITLLYASRNWPNAALSLTLFGIAFVSARLLFAKTINRFGGFPVAALSLLIECAGLILIWKAAEPASVLFGAALTGLGFSLVFPALGVEAVRQVPAPNRGAALGAYTVFFDCSLAITGPIAGLVADGWGYASVFLFAGGAAAMAAALTWLLVLRVARRRPAMD